MSDTHDNISLEELEAVVLAKVVEDPAFAARLKADPKAVLAGMFNVAFPEDLNVHVFQETPNDLMLRLPMSATANADGELSEGELEGVAGGVGGRPPSSGAKPPMRDQRYRGPRPDFKAPPGR